MLWAWQGEELGYCRDLGVLSAGHTCHELFNLRMGKYDKLPDLVVWPGSHEDVENIVRIACDQNVCLIPFGGQ